MKICAAQTRPATGDVQRNIEHHLKFVDLAVSCGADVIIFPELSLTGYEPALAKELATTQSDPRFDEFQKTSDAGQITIGVGAPTTDDSHICISLIIFQPHAARSTYSKFYLHPDEEAFFAGGRPSPGLIGKNADIALAICYELSVPEHAEAAFATGAHIYFASVAKFAHGIDRAKKRLSEIATQYSMTVLMANCVGKCDGSDCAGQTSIWNKQGELLGQLNGTDEGIIIFDTDTQETVVKMV